MDIVFWTLLLAGIVSAGLIVAFCAWIMMMLTEPRTLSVRVVRVVRTKRGMPNCIRSWQIDL